MKFYLIQTPILLLLLMSFSQKAESQKQLNLKACLWNYNSVCDIGDTLYPPNEIIIYKGTSLFPKACRQFENDFGHPTITNIIIENTSSEDVEFPIHGLDDVSVQTDNETLSPLAIRLRMGVFVNVEGTISIKLNPGETGNLFFIFDKAKVGDHVIIGNNKIIIE